MSGWWRRNRLAALLAAAVVAVLGLAVVVAGQGPRGVLDPDGYDPSGAHALQVLLEQQGVTVTRTTDVPTTVQSASTATTVFVPLPSLLSTEELQAVASLPGGLVVAEADQEALTALGVTAQVVGLDETRDRDPGCHDDVAVRAGRAVVGGFAYRLDGAVSCYEADGGGFLVRSDRIALLGAADALTNAHLDEEGNAALAVGLLAQQRQVLWLVPSPTRAAFGERPVGSADDLLPRWLTLTRWQLLVAAGVLALWRGRRLGRVVLERLPVVVRASETVEGHGRLYHSAGARDVAAEALREPARRALTRLAHGGSVTPEVLVELAAGRSGRDPAAVRSLLYGPTPTDDAALVRLAHSLDALAHEALTREGAGT
ncbi:MAG TPA: DUF4350 domain-containing protein [Mycobacteriales bacterium]|nr:DUF4350 domain-containing protein [Mycobacteriales bacterium]